MKSALTVAALVLVLVLSSIPGFALGRPPAGMYRP
jgi:hypothetical protein